MSLFKICDWWSTQCTDVDENFDSFSIIISRFGLKDNEKDYVVVGSHSGNLSIFYPNSNGNAKNTRPNTNFKPVDLLLESKLDFPILMLSTGKFSNNLRNGTKNQLVVLHPHSLVIHNITNVKGLAEHGSQYTLETFTEHKFDLSAFSLCSGSFGQVKDRDFICVVHLNGSMTFYEQDGISYQCNLEGPRSIPSTVLYNSRTDTFLTMNSFWNMECYSYQDLSHSGITSNKVHPIWSIILGEYILDMNIVQTEENVSSVIVLGERNLINVSDSGVINFILKLDYVPKCFTSFLVGYYWDKESSARHITTVLSENSSILIYEGAKLLWAAQHENHQVSIMRGNFEDLNGGIVTLSANGLLQIGYLGSEPFIFQVPQLNVQELNFELSHQELVQLENEIKDSIDSDDVKLINIQAENELEIIEFSISPNLQASTFEPTDEELHGKQLMMCSGYLKYCNKINVDEMQILFNVPSGVSCSNSCQTFTNLIENRTDSMEIWFYINEKLNLPSTKVEVIVSYISKHGIPRIVKKEAHLPLTMFYKTVPGEKEASIKLTAKINRKSNIGNKLQNQPPPLSDIFPEFYRKESMVDKNVFGDMQVLGLSSILWSNKIVTVVPAKNSNRLRIQSNDMEVMAPIIAKIYDYVYTDVTIKTDHSDHVHIESNDNKLKLSTSSALSPFTEVLVKIDNHNTIQDTIMNQTSKMDSLWLQFKLFQRALQHKKDHELVDGVLMLIEKNYDDLVIEGDKLVEQRNTEKLIRNELNCCIVLVKRILKTFELDVKVLNLFQSAFVTPVEDWAECSWEESISPGINDLQSITSAKSIISATKLTISEPTKFDYDKFKNNVSLVFSQVCEQELGNKPNNN
ncbi:BBS9 family protein [Megaselia abdita]